jgi:hypothetical protein
VLALFENVVRRWRDVTVHESVDLEEMVLALNRVWRAFVRAGRVKERVLRAFRPSRMHFIHYTWPLTPDVCPCDLHFCEYLKDRNIHGKAIFHFGTGAHHIVGLRNRDDGLENDIFAITASPGEHTQYLKHIIADGSLGRHYKVLFADIYELTPASLPAFDLVTLFHLCEFDDSTGPRRRMNDSGVLQLFLSKLAPQGRLLFYSGSDGRKQTGLLIERAVADGRMTLEEKYKSLLIYRAGTS